VIFLGPRSSRSKHGASTEVEDEGGDDEDDEEEGEEEEEEEIAERQAAGPAVVSHSNASPKRSKVLSALFGSLLRMKNK
jgi:hypothetical protein